MLGETDALNSIQSIIFVKQTQYRMIPISVVIITYNEEKNIEGCIQSVKSIADEIIVVDSGSTDQTVNISSALGAKVIHHPFEGHIEQKNFAVTQSTYPHILSLDADERIDSVLKEEILKIKADWKFDGYSMNRLNNYCGQFIKHGAWYPDKKLRLWDSRKGKWKGMNPHDRFEMIEGSTIQHLKGHIEHFSYYTIQDHKQKVHYFSEIAAASYYKKGRRSSILKLIIHPVVRFIRDYFLKSGWMDGRRGWHIAVISAWEVYLKYRTLLKMQKH
jgi:glycosyltransferase involved in cell wall biosynthesis